MELMDLQFLFKECFVILTSQKYPVGKTQHTKHIIPSRESPLYYARNTETPQLTRWNLFTTSSNVIRHWVFDTHKNYKLK